MLETTKSATPALQLLQFLMGTVGNMDLPLAAKMSVLNGLMTPGEIKDLVDRIAIREALLKAMRENGGEVNLTIIAKECRVSSGLVARVLKAIRDEYPPVPVTDEPLKLLLPKEARAREILDDILADADFVIEGKQINDVRNELAPIPVRFERGRDMVTFLKAGVAQYAFVGNDKTCEVLAEE